MQASCAAARSYWPGPRPLSTTRRFLSICCTRMLTSPGATGNGPSTEPLWGRLCDVLTGATVACTNDCRLEGLYTCTRSTHVRYTPSGSAWYSKQSSLRRSCSCGSGGLMAVACTRVGTPCELRARAAHECGSNTAGRARLAAAHWHIAATCPALRPGAAQAPHAAPQGREPAELLLRSSSPGLQRSSLCDLPAARGAANAHHEAQSTEATAMSHA